MKILITGGDGFIGSNLIKYLDNKHKITCLSKGYNFDKLKGFNVELVKGDITDNELVNKIVKGKDIVIHLAGGGGNKFFLENPVDAIETNLNGTKLLIEKAKENNVKKFIFSSSYIAYSTYKERKLPLKENNELLPDEFYGATKVFAEKEVMKFKNYLILRFATVYGYGLGFGSQWDGVIGRFIKTAYNEGYIPVYGDGKQKIDFIHVDDLCNAIILLIDKNINGLFNIGGDRGIEILEVANIVKVIFKEKGKNIEIKNLTGRVFPDRYMDVEKIKKIGWKPKISLKEGIKEMIEKYKGD